MLAVKPTAENAAARSTEPQPTARRLALAAVLAWGLAAAWPTAGHAQTAAAARPEVGFAGRLEFEDQSPYSHVCIRRQGSVRSMLFVRDSGDEVLESQVDLKKPHELRFEYLRAMFASYLLRDEQPEVLIVGLGGGGMVHFLRRFDPTVHVDVVEIDPLVVRLADKYFGVRSGGNVNIVTADGFEFIAESTKKYDVIYMDAFLKPSAETDATGVPLELRTREFYQQLQTRLKPGGLVVFNINPHAELADDVRVVRESFAQTYVFPLSRQQGVVAAASMDPRRRDRVELMQRAKLLQKRFGSVVPLADLARRAQE